MSVFPCVLSYLLQCSCSHSKDDCDETFKERGCQSKQIYCTSTINSLSYVSYIYIYIFIYTINNDSPSSFHTLLLVTFSLQVHHKEFQEAFLHLQTRNKCLRTTFHAVSVELLNSYIYNPDSVSCGFSFCPLGR